MLRTTEKILRTPAVLQKATGRPQHTGSHCIWRLVRSSWIRELVQTNRARGTKPAASHMQRPLQASRVTTSISADRNYVPRLRSLTKTHKVAIKLMLQSSSSVVVIFLQALQEHIQVEQKPDKKADRQGQTR